MIEYMNYLNHKYTIRVIFVGIILILLFVMLYNQNKNKVIKTKINNKYETIYLKDKSNNKIDIFSNIKTIAPGSKGTYHFNIYNNTKDDVNYNLVFKEDNKFNIDIKYKLKRDNKYLIDNYVRLNQFIIGETILDINKYDTYELDWKWFDSKNDNKIKDDSFYEIKLITESKGIKKDHSK